jgi:hypothetical protein
LDNQYIINPLSLYAILNFSFFFATFRSVSFRSVLFCLISFRFFRYISFCTLQVPDIVLLTGVILQWGDLTWTWSHFDNLIAAIQIHEIVFIDGQSCLQRLSELLFVDSPRCGCAIFISTLSSKVSLNFAWSHNIA